MVPENYRTVAKQWGRKALFRAGETACFLLDRLREQLRLKHYSLRTEEPY